MPIRPIDVYTMSPKSQETSQLQKNSQDRATHGEQLSNVQYHDKVNGNMRKTVQTKDKDDKGFRFDAKEKGHNEYQDNRKKKKKEETSSDQKSRYPSMNSSSFDITI